MSVRLRTVLAALSAAVLVLAGAATPAQATAGYSVGVGIGDITGQAAEVGMLGYADPGQTTEGIHTRQWARAFVLADEADRRVALVNTDLAFVPQAVQQDVLGRLRARFGTRYTAANLLLTANHTHSGPGGFSHHTLYSLTTRGFERATYEAIVAGTVRAVVAADADLAPGTVRIATGTLAGANVNRSRAAFDRNPAADRARFPDAVDRRMTVLRFDRGGTAVGMVSWFPTHGTSMTPANRLISGDNKGYAAQRTEHDHGVGWAERGDFVAAFAQTAAGDMSPNVRGGGAQGPTDDEFQNTKISGDLQADAAARLFDSAGEVLTGPIDARQRYVDFSGITVSGAWTPDGAVHRTCPAALGQAFTAGAEDGPGPDIVDEGELAANPLLVAAGVVVTPVPEAVRQCQAPKPIFLGTGSQRPPWTPQVLPLQILRIGQFVVTGVPAEVTIVAGQRMLDAVGARLGGIARHQVLAGYAGAYAGYVTTPEEYDVQHYEGASTHFGRYTLPAYQQELAQLATALRDGVPAPASAVVPSLADRQISVRPGIVFDAPQIGRSFGAVLTPPAASYRPGATVKVEFSGAHPGNDLRNEGTFLEVQRLDGKTWRTVATDDDWSTTFRWRRDGVAASVATITWTVPAGTTVGSYRIRYGGDARSLFGQVSAIGGTTTPFAVAG